MPPPKKPKTKESWEEFISESQAENSVDKRGASLHSCETDREPFRSSVCIVVKEPVDCSYPRFTRPETPVTLVPEDLSMKLKRNACLNGCQDVSKETTITNGCEQIQDRSPSAGHHPQLRSILMHSSHLPDVGENLVSSGVGSQDLELTRVHSSPSGSPNSSKTLWKNPSKKASENELQPLAAFSTNLPSRGNSPDKVSLLDSSRRERNLNPSGMQFREEIEICRFELGRRDQNLSFGNAVVRENWPHVTSILDGGYVDNDNRYSASQTKGLCDQDRRSVLGYESQTADSTTHLVSNSNQMKRCRLNGDRMQARNQAVQPYRGQNAATHRSIQELKARGSTSKDRVEPGDQQGLRNFTSELSSSEIQSQSQMTIARLFTELHQKDVPVMDRLVSVDMELLMQHQIQKDTTTERILSQLLPRAFKNTSRTPLSGKPQTEGEFGQRKVERGPVIANKLCPSFSSPPRLDSPKKMATLRELLRDDSEKTISSGSALPSGEVSRANISDSGAAHRIKEIDEVVRMEIHVPVDILIRQESLENENSCEIPAQLSSDLHSSPEMPSSSSCNERGRNKADEKGVCRCQICDDVASGFHYGVWSCEGCKAFFKRSLHGPVDYVCPATNNCTIDKLRRKSCQACRLRKCHEAGMTAGISRKEKGSRPTGKKRKSGEEELLSISDPDAASSSCFGKLARYDSVGSPHEAAEKPSLSPVREMKHSPSLFPASPSIPQVPCRDSPQPSPLVERLLSVELPPREAEYSCSIANSSLHLLSGLMGLINSQLVDIITWSKSLPDFSKSSLESRTRLLVASWSELLILGTAWQSMPQPNVWVCAPNLLLSRAHCKVVMIETLFDRIMCLVQTLRRLQLTKTELVLLRLTILLNSDSSVIETQPPLANLRNLLDETWQQMSQEDANTTRSRLSHLLLTLPDIRQCSLMMQDVINNARHQQGVPAYSLLHEMLDCDSLRMSDMRAGTAGVD